MYVLYSMRLQTAKEEKAKGMETRQVRERQTAVAALATCRTVVQSRAVAMAAFFAAPLTKYTVVG